MVTSDIICEHFQDRLQDFQPYGNALHTVLPLNAWACDHGYRLESHKSFMIGNFSNFQLQVERRNKREDYTSEVGLKLKRNHFHELIYVMEF